MIFQLIPARGRKPERLQVGYAGKLYFNLSPQGDGNIKKMIPDFTSLNYFNLSPQGDGNLDITEDAAIDGISTYPRKGTETLNFFAKIEERQISTYPRKGTETSAPVPRT